MQSSEVLAIFGCSSISLGIEFEKLQPELWVDYTNYHPLSRIPIASTNEGDIAIFNYDLIAFA